ncbi:MAG: hypothetical protein KA149_01255 [Chitinophagales bacterium]|nr:hypothetical protein [Chitinophagales bacterium]
MLRSLILFIGTLCFSFVQAQNFKLEIGSKTISFLLDEKIDVERTVTDSIIRCKSSFVKKFPLGSSITRVAINPAELKTLYREIFNDKGCIWTRITNDEIIKDTWYGGTYPVFLYDSITTVKRPRECWHIDTVMQINPITLGEDQIVDIDSTNFIKYNLSAISRVELARAISGQFGLTTQVPPMHIHYLALRVVDEKCDGMYIDYRNQQSIQDAIHAFNDLKTGVQIIISSLKFEETSGSRFKAGQIDLHDIAVMTLED